MTQMGSADSHLNRIRPEVLHMNEVTVPNAYRGERSESSSDEEEDSEQDDTNKKEDEPAPLDNPKPLNGLPVRAESDPTELLKENTRLREERLCRICYDREANIVFGPCGHLATCGNCASAFRDCPVCRAPIQHTVKTFMA